MIAASALSSPSTDRSLADRSTTRWLRSAGLATSVASMSTPRPSTGSSAAARRRCRSRSTSTNVGRYQATTCMSLPWARSMSAFSRPGSMTSAAERSWPVWTYTVCTPASAIASMSVRSTDGVAPANSFVQSSHRSMRRAPVRRHRPAPGGGSGRSLVRTTSSRRDGAERDQGHDEERGQALSAAPALAPRPRGRGRLVHGGGGKHGALPTAMRRRGRRGQRITATPGRPSADASCGDKHPRVVPADASAITRSVRISVDAARGVTPSWRGRPHRGCRDAERCHCRL